MQKPVIPPNHVPEVPLPKLSFWMDGAKNTVLARAAQAFFGWLGKAAFWAVEQFDPMTCPEVLLDILSWQRGIDRYPGETDRFYRLRVLYAYINGVDAGSIDGWQRIFTRLELGPVGLEERVPGQDWDVIGIAVDDTKIPDVQNVLEIIINEYGRTCRRYRFISRIPQAVHVAAGCFCNDHTTVYAKAAVEIALGVKRAQTTFDNHHETVVAQQ
ncbi:phage tail protein [Desulfovibrio cuneatus]|uniref:phage tail protein n=1 Tax=Desulfovibrio cuneatus TaxID=159728 RepID=UPI0004016824|nr:phage tail protein [Desulfovibrio cuneatus]